jgi:hypothetical protein
MLKDLGVTSVGHRLKLLEAIAALRTDTSAPGPSNDLKTTPSAPSPSPEDRAERRQVAEQSRDPGSVAAPYVLAGTEKYHSSTFTRSIDHDLQQILYSARIKYSYSSLAASDPRVAEFPKPTVAARTENTFECSFTEAGGADFP